MQEKHKSIFYQNIAGTLKEWQLSESPWSEKIMEQIQEGSVYWQEQLDAGNTLTLFRVYSPIVQREEVFLGNVLLNDFLFSSVPESLILSGAKRVCQIANDLESAYFLIDGILNLQNIQSLFLDIIQKRLPELYFGTQDLNRGIHGQFLNMLTFYKANIEPFPIFAIPIALLPSLLEKVNYWLHKLSSKDGIRVLADMAQLSDEVAESRRINVLLAVLSFFYCQDGAEMQSFHKFLVNAIDDGRLPKDTTLKAFGLQSNETFSKEHFNDAKKDSKKIDFEAIENALASGLRLIDDKLKNNRVSEVAPYQTKKMLSATLEQTVLNITTGLQLGYVTLNPIYQGEFACRFCGNQEALIQECHIIGGINTGRGFNQSVRKTDNRFCVRCALAAYLSVKRLGMQFDGGFPIPKLYNLFFHYGQHSDLDIKIIQRQIDLLVQHAKNTQQTLVELNVMVNDLRVEMQHIVQPMEDAELDTILSNLPAISEWAEPAREVLAQLQQDTITEILPLGLGNYRLFVFILPQLRSGGKETLDFVQKRFSASRLASFTLIAMLRNLCGCRGPFYFQSLPKLIIDIEDGIFYVQNRIEHVDDALRKYGAIVNFARRVSLYRKGHSLLGDWILLAEKLLADPLGIYTDILRNSPIRVRDESDKAKFKRLNNQFIPGLNVVDGIEYLQLFEQLKQLQKEIN